MWGKIFQAIIIFLLLMLSSTVFAQEFRYQVEQERMLKNYAGEMTIKGEGIEFLSTDKKVNYFWKFLDIKTIEIRSPVQARIWTYQDNSLILGSDERFTFKVLSGKLDDIVIDFLRHQSERPFVISYAVDTKEKPMLELAVKHQHRMGGCQGLLKIYQDHLSFETTDGRDSRQWRWQEIQSIGRIDEWRLELYTYEPQFGKSSRNYQFLLKERMSENIYDYLWNHINLLRPSSLPDSKSYFANKPAISH